MSAQPLHELTASQAADLIRWGELSPVELVQACLARIEALDSTVQAWERVDADGALAQARQREQEVREARSSFDKLRMSGEGARLTKRGEGERRSGEGARRRRSAGSSTSAGPSTGSGRAEAFRRAQGVRLGPLHGVPVGIKDIYHVAGLPTTAGFRPFTNNVAAEDSAAVARLRAAGAIILGKTVTTQFAFADPARTRNPWNTERTPGGSSSGSAAGVAARMMPLALGTQTAGSTLRPAAYCGVVGFKPTFGRISRRGILPLAWSLDHVGIIVRDVQDAALALHALAGYDPLDPYSADVPVDDYVGAAAGPSTGSGRAVPPHLLLVEDFLERAAPQTQQHVRDVARRLEAAGARVDLVRLPDSLDVLLAAQHLLMQVEATAVHAQVFARHPDDYGPLLRGFLEVGQLVPGAAYVHAKRLTRRLRAALLQRLGVTWAGTEARLTRRPAAPSPARPSALLTPTATDVAPAPSTTGDRAFQAPWTLLGLPAISLPSGLSLDGLPLGIQLATAPFRETQLLAAARWCELALGSLTTPPL